MRCAVSAKKPEGGFTLVELLIVIIVLAILAAIVVLSVGNTKTDAAQSSCRAGIKAIELSAEALNTRSSGYPTGMFDESSSPNPVLAASGTGALLKMWPTSDAYRLTYSFDPLPVAEGGAGDTTYHINVLDRNGTDTE